MVVPFVTETQQDKLKPEGRRFERSRVQAKADTKKLLAKNVPYR
jgi:hypothetical protein